MRFEYRIVLRKLLPRVEPCVRLQAVLRQLFHVVLLAFEHSRNAASGEFGNGIALRKRVQIAAAIETAVENRIKAEEGYFLVRPAGRNCAETHSQTRFVG